MTTLFVLQLSDSFSSAWPALAEECDVALEVVSEAAELDRRRLGVVLVAAGGEEGRLEDVVRELAPTGTEIVAVGALPDRHLATRVVRAGASDYFALAEDHDLLRSCLRDLANRLRMGDRRSAFADGEARKYRFDDILGQSPALATALEQASRIIPHPHVTVLITGETGTGKELMARAIHYNGPRREAPFVDINCAAIPEQLLESELFGHEKGAFTDASTTKPGLFEEAHGGTLFLDEIGHLPMGLQGKLLRALEERQIRRLGGSRSIAVDVRIIAATHVNLAQAVRRGEFREDLYYRLNVVPLQLPSLRARRDDIVPLAQHFLARFAGEYGATLRLSASAERALHGYDWPGNVRELRNAIERAVLLAHGAVLDAEDFLFENTSPTTSDRIPFPAPLADVVRSAVSEMLELCGGNKSEAARRLEISRTRLLRVLDVDEGNAQDSAARDGTTRNGITRSGTPRDSTAELEA